MKAIVLALVLVTVHLSATDAFARSFADFTWMVSNDSYDCYRMDTGADDVFVKGWAIPTTEHRLRNGKVLIALTKKGGTVVFTDSYAACKEWFDGTINIGASVIWTNPALR